MTRSRRAVAMTATAVAAALVAAGVLSACSSSGGGGAAASASAPGASAGVSPTARPGPTAEPAAPVWGFVRSDELSSPIGQSRTPATTVQAGSWQATANTASGQATVVRRDTGRYTVTFPSIGVPGGKGAAVVSAFGVAAGEPAGGRPAHCHVDDWSASGPDQQVTLGCRAFTGAYVDSRFTALFTFAPGSYRPAEGGPYAYFRDDTPSETLVKPANQYSIAGPTGTIEINRVGTGHYTIDLIGARYVRPGNNLQVNAVGAAVGGCSALGREVKADRQSIFVGCAVGSTWTDLPFVVVYANQHAMIANESVTFAHAFTGQQQPDGKIAQPPLGGAAVPAWDRYSANSSGAPNTIRHPAPGTYEVVFGGVGGTPDDVQVTPYGEPTHRCAVDSWAPGTGAASHDITVKVLCVDPGGNKADTQFSLAYLRAEPAA